jgi:hypothetical protein
MLTAHVLKGQVRAHEFACGQVVSLLDVDGIGVATVRALYEVGLDTADKLAGCPAEQVAQLLAKFGVPKGDSRRRVEVVVRWQMQIRELKEKAGRAAGGTK